MKILVTGATGVVGSRLLPLLRRAGHDVTGAAHSDHGRAEIEGRGTKAMVVDLLNPSDVQRAVTGHDTVVNLATHIPASTVQMFFPWAWRENDRLRRNASAILVEACIAANVSRFVQESFAPVYPDCGDRWIDETVSISPVRYNRTVADAEASAHRFSESGRTGIVLRFGAFYGPDAAQTIELIKWAKKGRFPIPGSPSAYISSVSHYDAATAVAAALAVPAGIYNVVDDEPVTHIAFALSLATALHVAPPKLPAQWLIPLFGSLGKMAARSLRISNHKLRTVSGWAPKYSSVREGWPQTIAQISPAGAGKTQDIAVEG